MPAGVVRVLDLRVVLALVVVVLALLRPAGLRVVLDRTVVLVAGVCAVVVVFVERFRMMVVVPGIWADTSELPSRLMETRNPNMRFIIAGNGKVGKCLSYGVPASVVVP